MEALNNFIGMLNGPIWGVGMLILIVGSGLYFTVRLGFFQFVHFGDMWKRILDKGDSESGISTFASFCTTMAMRVGTGNVAGVAVAIYAGGPGAIFWMILAGMTNSAVCFVECVLSSLYKTKIDGEYRGGGPTARSAAWAGSPTASSWPSSASSASAALCPPPPPTPSLTALRTLWASP